jgi:hypothetical protein
MERQRAAIKKLKNEERRNKREREREGMRERGKKKRLDSIDEYMHTYMYVTVNYAGRKEKEKA